MDALKLIESQSMKSELPELNIGDTVKVHVKIKEGDKETWWSSRDLYGSPRISRMRSRKSIPGSFSECG